VNVFVLEAAILDSSLVIVGLSSQTSPSSVRERFGMDEIGRVEAAAKLTRSEGISEAIVVVTKARIEYIVWADDPSDAAEEDAECLRSAMENAWTQARNAGTSGRMLDALLTKALALADSAKTHTPRGEAASADVAAEVIAAEAKQFQKKLLAERVAPAVAVVRVRVEDICRQELDAFERALGPVNEPQKNTLAELKVRITKRIASEVEHELKGLDQTVSQENLAETARRLIGHTQMRDVVSRSHN
jgi:glutamyl-tRNA reductase